MAEDLSTPSPEPKSSPSRGRWVSLLGLMLLFVGGLLLVHPGRESFPEPHQVGAVALLWLLSAFFITVPHGLRFRAELRDMAFAGLSLGTILAMPIVPYCWASPDADTTWFLGTILATLLTGIVVHVAFNAQGKYLYTDRELPDMEGEARSLAASVVERAGLRPLAIKLARLGSFNALVQGMRACVVVVDRRASESLPPDEFSALIAHEAGHVKTGGILPYISVHAIVLVFMNVQDVAGWTTLHHAGTFVGLFFGLRIWVSQRLEFACDRFAADMLGSSAVANMLRKAYADMPSRLTRFIGAPLSVPFLSHPSLAVRLAALGESDLEVLKWYRTVWQGVLWLCFILPCGSFLVWNAVDATSIPWIVKSASWMLPGAYFVLCLLVNLTLLRIVSAFHKVSLSGARAKSRRIRRLFFLVLILLIAVTASLALAPSSAEILALPLAALLLLLLVLIIAALLTGAFRSNDLTTLPMRVRRAVAEVQAAFDEAKPDEGLELANRALEVDRGHPWLLAQKSGCLVYLGRLDEARDVLEEVLDAFPGFPLARLNLCIVQLLRGALDEAEEAARELCEAAPADASTWHLRGMGAYQAVNYDAAAQYFEKAAALKQRNGPALAGRTLVSLDRGECPDVSREWMDIAWASEPNNPLIIAAKARWEQLGGDPECARETLETIFTQLEKIGARGWMSYYKKLGERWGLLQEA